MSITKTRRYYLHSKLKKFVKINACANTIFIPVDKEEECKKSKWWKYAVELKNHCGYNLQFTIE